MSKNSLEPALTQSLEKKSRKSHSDSGHDESNWLVSYADMMTLLCGFFIMMFSMAKLDEPKYDSLRESIAKQFGGKFESVNKELFDYATNFVAELGIENAVRVKADPLGVSIVIESTLFFETLGTEVSVYGKSILENIIRKINERQKTTQKVLRIVVEGHTDSRKILGGNFPTNWELSGARAARIVRMFIDQGFSPAQLTAIGYADTRPLALEKTIAGTMDEESLKKNRRVVIRILRPGVDSIPIAEEMVPGTPYSSVSPSPSLSPELSFSLALPPAGNSPVPTP